MNIDDVHAEPDGITVRLDVQTDSPGRAAEVAETLARMTAGFAAEGLVASMILHPSRFTVGHDLDAQIIDPDDEDET